MRICVDSNVASDPFSNLDRNAHASSMPTGSIFPVSVCLRSFTNVSVMAVTPAIGPFSHIAVSMQ